MNAVHDMVKIVLFSNIGSRSSKKNIHLSRLVWLLLVFVVAVSFFVLAAFWYRQDARARAEMFDTPTNNLLSNGSFEDVNPKSGEIANWHVATSGPTTHIASIRGYIGNRDMQVTVSNYRTGQVSIEHDKITLTPNKDYFFKAYYTNKVGFDLLVHYYYTDGTDKLVWTQHYPAVDQSWSTMSTVIHPASNVKAVSFVVNIAGNGSIALDGAYLIREDGLYQHPNPQGITNLIPNADFQQPNDNNSAPAKWLVYHTGNNQPTFAFSHDGTRHFVTSTVANYQDGEAKWQYQPLPVSPGQYFNFSVDYRSNVQVDLVAEYTLAGGSQGYSQLATLSPTDNTWNTYGTTFQTLPNATDMFVSLVLHGNGSIDSTNYRLADITSGPTGFNHPLISLTFDDGWESQFTQALPVLTHNHWPATFYINSDNIGTNQFLNFQQLQTLHDQNFEIASHGDDELDMTLISPTLMHKQLDVTKNYLQQNFHLKAVDYASPFGKHDAQTDAYTARIFTSHRGTSSGVNTRQNFDPYDLKVLYVSNDTNVQLVQSYIDEAQVENGWLILVYHRFGSGSGESEITPSTFAAQMGAVGRSGIPVVTVNNAFETLKPQLK